MLTYLVTMLIGAVLVWLIRWVGGGIVASIVIISIIASVVALLHVLLRTRSVTAGGRWTNVRKRLWLPLEFDFKTNWVSTLTTAGAILGTAASAGLLPEDTFLMAKAQYTALNVVFGLTVLAAVTLYNLVRRSGILLIAGALVLGAAVGELVTTIFLFSEMMYQDTMPVWPVRFLDTLLFLAVIVVPPVAAWRAIQVASEAAAEPAAFISPPTTAQID
jgi:hypothetical protein